MGCRNEKDFCVPAGETFRPTLRWGSGVYTTKPITAITKATPAVVTAVGHSLPNGWPCACVGVQGMTQINATRYPPQGDDWSFGTVLSADTVAFNSVSSANFSAYTSGGALVYDTPAVLTGMTITMTVYSDPDHETVLTTLSSVTPAQIAVDLTLMTITPTLQTAALTWDTGYYLVQATDSGGIITELLRGVINLET